MRKIRGRFGAIGVVTALTAMLLAALSVPAWGQNNPVPFVNQPLVPTTAAPGEPAFTLTVKGTGFVSSSAVHWNGTALPTTFVSGSEVTASVPASDIAVAGTASVTVVNPAPGGGVSNTAFFQVTVSTPTLVFGNSFISGAGGYQVVSGDFNNDGILDLAVANSFYGVYILLGNGDGTFTMDGSYAASEQPEAVAIGDFNGDGKIDLATANYNVNTASVLLGNGDGTFQPPTDYATDYYPQALLAADFNGDGKLDLAVLTRCGGDPSCYSATGSVSVLLGNGNGTFQSQSTYGVEMLPASSIVTGDFNGDGVLDLAVPGTVNELGAGIVAILTGNGAGGFSSGFFYTSQYSDVYALVAADLNGDGKLDLAATAAGYTYALLAYLGNGDGTFTLSSTQSLPVLYQSNAAAVGDFNGDGILDLTASVESSGSSYFAFGNGDGTFQPLQAFTGGGDSLAIGDFNRDGRLDLAVGSSFTAGVTILLQKLTPVAALSTSSLTFGDQTVGTASAPQIVTLTNTGSATLSISSIAVTGDFQETNTCGQSVAPLASCTLTVSFKPRAQGTRSGAISITDNAAGSPQHITLTGVGTAVFLSTTSVNFHQVPVGSSSPPVTVTAQNRGKSTLTVGIGITGKNGTSFSQTNTCGGSIGSGQSCTISVTFSPKTIGALNAAVSIVDAGGGSPQMVALSGTGTALRLSPSTLNFGNVPVGEISPDMLVSVTNVAVVGESFTVTIGGADSTDFIETNSCNDYLRPGQTCSIVVNFIPTRTGTRTASLSINDGGGGGPQAVRLTGVGE